MKTPELAPAAVRTASGPRHAGTVTPVRSQVDVVFVPHPLRAGGQTMPSPEAGAAMPRSGGREINDVRVNATVIPAARIVDEARHHRPLPHRSAEQEAATALVVRELLLQEARRQAIAPAPSRADDVGLEGEEEALIRRLLEREVRVPQVREQDCRRYYDANPARFRGRALFEASHILLAASREDAAAYSRALVTARDIIDVLRAEPERFENMAREFSACRSAREGGRLGQLHEGQATPEFESALRQLAPGAISEHPVQARYGVHVIRLERMEPARPAPFGSVRQRIGEYLQEASLRRGIAQYIALLAGGADIRGADLDGSDSPLVQ